MRVVQRAYTPNLGPEFYVEVETNADSTGRGVELTTSLLVNGYLRVPYSWELIPTAAIEKVALSR